MSLLVNDRWPDARTFSEENTEADQRDLNRLDRYLSIMETNKKACRFVPDDALIALDMAGFVRGCLTGRRSQAPVSVARLAMVLAQAHSSNPVQ